MPLNDMQCRTAKPRIKLYKLFDGSGLYLEVRASGTKRWRQKYRLHGKEKLLSHGGFPEVSLLEARMKTLAAKKEIKAGIDPNLAIMEAKQLAILNRETTFQELATNGLINKSTYGQRGTLNRLSFATINIYIAKLELIR